MADRVRIHRFALERKEDGTWTAEVEFEGVFGPYSAVELSEKNRRTVDIVAYYVFGSSYWEQPEPRQPQKIEDLRIDSMSEAEIDAFLRGVAK